MLTVPALHKLGEKQFTELFFYHLVPPRGSNPPRHFLGDIKKYTTNVVHFFMKTNPYFDTNAPPFEVRGCKVILGGAFWGQGVQNTN